MTKKALIESLEESFRQARIERDRNDDPACQDLVIRLMTILGKARKLKKEEVSAFADSYGIEA